MQDSGNNARLEKIKSDKGDTGRGRKRRNRWMGWTEGERVSGSETMVGTVGMEARQGRSESPQPPSERGRHIYRILFLYFFIRLLFFLFSPPLQHSLSHNYGN